MWGLGSTHDMMFVLLDLILHAYDLLYVMFCCISCMWGLGLIHEMMFVLLDLKLHAYDMLYVMFCYAFPFFIVYYRKIDLFYEKIHKFGKCINFEFTHMGKPCFVERGLLWV